MSKKPVIALAAGGTGGHVFPAEALAHELISRGASVILVTDPRGEKLTEKFPCDQKLVVKSASPSKNPIKLFVWFLSMIRSRHATIKFLKKHDCDHVVGFGGYPSVPAILAARSLKLPLGLHEQNAVLGRANRLGAVSVNWIASGFETLNQLPTNKNIRHLVTGNPLRPALMQAINKPFPTVAGDLNLCVLGGSLGARILSDTVPAAIALLPKELRKRLFVVAQITKDRIKKATETFASAGVRCELAPFFDDVASRLAMAHLVVARAGASSVSELAAMGKPCILIPLAIAMDDHQTINAGELKKAGAADVISEEELTPEKLAALLQVRLSDLPELSKRAEAAKSVARVNAATKLADLVLEKRR
ncbi:MAG: UDP-N-acetylglucosamine--N-acetylmuramyl-(pentapeptide) pyrophosphoryl-undecaprenol N-acetylglucosamine transferase [Robiginitomaculum sp.]|nr:UDP-N-acetylglucosamine--N-acetylmuramyl-(pentapeptide) pyrophosphoryl-undecaprenol N-acetylglucosamine transferase [Robiginitomaculum sp.]